ncbi:MAG: HAMP domain-containing histidine kinase [Proteobacteria bacterium]|nr:HAMP domain-containing histidine kinase [Pseudomonadota bacterium]
MAEREPSDHLTTALRAAAARASEASGGGCALLFCAAPGQTPDVRAAAGFETPEAAKAAAVAMLPQVVEVTKSPSLATTPPPEGFEGPTTVTLFPIETEGRTHGALVVGTVAELEESRQLALERLTANVAFQLDYAVLKAEVGQLRGALSEQEQQATAKQDELLKLSEELFAQDIELLRSNEKLGKVEQLKNDFIEKMSRELRTPLNSIIEAIIAVLAGENDALSDHAKDNLRTALDEGAAFLRTLQNILDLWRIKQGELPIESQDVNFAEVVEEAIFSVQDTLGDKPVVIEKKLDAPFPKLKTDLAKINQILFLLLDNAAKFTREGRIEIRARVEEGELRCELQDTGIGICPDDQEFMFDEFFQVDELSSTRYRGAGLGLALVKDLLHLLDGTIKLESEVGIGTTVRFSVPAHTV